MDDDLFLSSIQNLADHHSGALTVNPNEELDWNLSPEDAVKRLEETLIKKGTNGADMTATQVQYYVNNLIRLSMIPRRCKWLALCYFGGPETFGAACEMATNSEKTLPCGKQSGVWLVKTARMEDQKVAELIRQEYFSDREFLTGLRDIRKNYELHIHRDLNSTRYSDHDQTLDTTEIELDPQLLIPNMPVIQFKVVRGEILFLMYSTIFIVNKKQVIPEDLESFADFVNYQKCHCLLAALQMANCANALKMFMSSSQVQSLIIFVGLKKVGTEDKMIVEISRSEDSVLFWTNKLYSKGNLAKTRLIPLRS